MLSFTLPSSQGGHGGVLTGRLQPHRSPRGPQEHGGAPACPRAGRTPQELSTVLLHLAPREVQVWLRRRTTLGARAASLKAG